MGNIQEEAAWESQFVAPSRLPRSSRIKQRLATYKPRNDSQEKLLAVAGDFIEGKVDPPLLLIYGPPGLGKTHLAWGIAWDYLENWERALYFQAEELLDELRNSFARDGYAGKVDRLRKCALLIIDDLGAQSTTDFGSAKLDMLVDYRYREGRATVITTNTLDLPDRILDRFREGVIIGVKGESYRKEKPDG